MLFTVGFTTQASDNNPTAGVMAASEFADVAVSTCPICWDSLDNPKVLPCLHAFCLKCIERHCATYPENDETSFPMLRSCPVCRSQFPISEEGAVALRDDPFLWRLAEDEKISRKKTAEDVPCEVCFGECALKAGCGVPSATRYCMDCCQKLCEVCSAPHRQWRGGAHDVRILDKQLEKSLINMHGSYCDRHRNERLKLYCSDCAVNLCMMCYAVAHRGHCCEEIEKAAGALESAITEKIDRVAAHASAAEKMAWYLDEEMLRFNDHAAKVKQQIIQHGEEIKRIVDLRIEEQLQEVEKKEAEASEYVERTQVAMSLAVVAMKSFNTYSMELMKRGTWSDVTRVGSDLNARADQLLSTLVRPGDYHTPFIYFEPAPIHGVLGSKLGNLQSSVCSGMHTI